LKSKALFDDHESEEGGLFVSDIVLVSLFRCSG